MNLNHYASMILILLLLPGLLFFPLDVEAVQRANSTSEIIECRGMNIVKSSSWPGLGVQLLVHHRDSTTNQKQYFQVTGGQEIPLLSVKIPPAKNQYVAVLIDSVKDAEQMHNVYQTAAAFIDQLKPAFQVALLVRGVGIDQISGFTNDSKRLLDLLYTYDITQKYTFKNQDFSVALPTAIKYMADTIRAVGSFELEHFQALVFIGKLPESVKYKNQGIPFYHLSPGTSPKDIGKFVEQLTAQPAKIERVGLCLQSDYDEKITVKDNSGNFCTFLPPLRAVEEDLLPCDQSAIVSNERNSPQKISLQFTAEENKIFQDYYSHEVKDEFKAGVKIGAAEPVPAKVHFRGRGSLKCPRKSFRINLTGKAFRNLGETIVSDKFYLIAMCGDAGYFHQYTANILARDLGLFPLSFRYIELVINKRSWGVYLLLNNPTEVLLSASIMSTTVLRRRYEPSNELPSIKAPESRGIDDKELSDYRDLISPPVHLSGRELYQWIENRMDVSKFLEFIALQTVLANGDWVDEVFFFSEQALLDNGFGNFYHIAAWDMDDLFKECHHSGKFEKIDPNLLTYCLEGKLEKRLLEDPFIYNLYIQHLEELLDNALGPASIATALETTLTDLTPYLSRSPVLSTMFPNIFTYNDDEAYSLVMEYMKKEMDDFYQKVLSRQQVLRARIKKYRQLRR